MANTPACEPHPQVLSPCSDDGVSVGQVLGTGGDVHFDEYGSLALTAGQVQATVVFNFEKESAGYVFEYLYIKSVDAIPDDIRAVVRSQTTKQFVVEFSGAPVTATDILVWRVVVPDPLHTCLPATSGPKYAIVRPSQQGNTSLIEGQDFIAVTFPVEQADNDWVFEAISFKNSAADIIQVFSWSVSSHTTLGFIINLSGEPEDGYTMQWKVA